MKYYPGKFVQIAYKKYHKISSKSLKKINFTLLSRMVYYDRANKSSSLQRQGGNQFQKGYDVNAWCA